jgi:hypothetical protein
VSVAEASDAARWIVFIGCGALRRKESHRQHNAEEARQFEQVFSHIEISPETIAAIVHLRRVISLSWANRLGSL